MNKAQEYILSGFMFAGIGVFAWVWAVPDCSPYFLNCVVIQTYPFRFWALLIWILSGVFLLVGIVRAAIQPEPERESPSVGSKVCLKCGYVVDPSWRLCPHCGNGLTKST